MFHSHVSFICYPSIPPSHSAGSAERSTNTLLVAWPAHNLLIAWPASPQRRFYSVFSHTIAFSPVFQCLSLHMFELTIVFTCFFPCFHLFTVFPSECTPTRLSRAIHQHSLVAWATHNFLITSPASPHKAQQSYQPHSAIDPILPSTLSPPKTPGTSFSLTSNTTLQFRVTLS